MQVLHSHRQDSSLRRNDPQWLGVERIDGSPEGMPWPNDSFQMAVTQHDYHTKRPETFNVAFAPPCHARWGLAAFQVTQTSSTLPPALRALSKPVWRKL